MSEVPRGLRELVIRRAGNRCEYCRLSQTGQEAAFHLDHIVPRAADGETIEQNLALACVSCSLRKGARQSVNDPETSTEVPLFNPRVHVWDEHFRWDGDLIVPLTSIGRATVTLLAINRSTIVAIRGEEMLRGRHPPEST